MAFGIDGNGWIDDGNYTGQRRQMIQVTSHADAALVSERMLGLRTPRMFSARKMSTAIGC
jgi:hypothetical protein